MNTTTLDVLTQARQVVASERWRPTMLCDREGKVCALGAIGVALGWTDEFLMSGSDQETYDVLGAHPATAALLAALPDEHRSHRDWWDVVSFNDAANRISESNYETHQKKVVALFDRAITDELARTQEQQAGEPVRPITVEQPVEA